MATELTHNPIEKDDVVVVVFPPTLGRFEVEVDIQFGSISSYEKSLCKNRGVVNTKVVEDEFGRDDEGIRDELQDVNNNEEVKDVHDVHEEKCEMMCDDGDENNKVVEDESRCDDEGIRDELQDVNNNEVKDVHYLEEIEPKCEIICDSDVSNKVVEVESRCDDELQDVLRYLETGPKCEIISDDNNSFLGDEEKDDVESVVIHVIDEETEQEKKLIKEMITNAEMELNEKTRRRDVTKDEIQKEKAKLKADNEVLNAANMEINTAKRLVTSKRLEIDYCQSVINIIKIKNVVSVEDINRKINEMDRMKKYETLWLTNENQFIRTIKQLKRMCTRLTMGSQDEIHLALILKDNINVLLKNLTKEMKSLKDNVSKAEVAARAIRKAYAEKNEKGKELLAELQAEYRVANELRQEAYGRLSSLSSLRKLLYKSTEVVEDNKENNEEEDEIMIAALVELINEAIEMEKQNAINDQNQAEMQVQEVEQKEKVIFTYTSEMEKQNAINDQNQAEMQSQKEAEQASLERLLNKEEKLASSVSSSNNNNNIDLGDVLVLNEPKEIEKPTEKPQQHSTAHFMPKKSTQKITSRVALGNSNQKWLLQHWRKMVKAIVFVILAVAYIFV